MSLSRRTLSTAAIAFVAVASASLIACSDAVSEGTPLSPESSEVTPTEVDPAETDPVDAHPAETDSATTDSAKVDSVETDSAEVDQAMIKIPCTAENEGMVDSIGVGLGINGWDNEYYRCEKGSWVKRESWIRCAKDAQEGDACIHTYRSGMAMMYNEIYVYTSNGVWEFYDGEHGLGKFTVRTDDGRKTEFYKYISLGAWHEIDEDQYTCFSKYDVQDTCALETDEGKNYYLTRTTTSIEHFPVWIKIDYDLELGFCSFNDKQKYGEKDSKRYYCSPDLNDFADPWERIEPKWVEIE